MKIKIFFTVFIFATLFCKSQNLKITVNNKTGFDLDSVVICDKKIGFMKKDTTLLLVNCKGLSEQSGAGYFYSKYGVINRKTKCINPNPIIARCGTGTEYVTEGWFEININNYYGRDSCCSIGFQLKKKK